MQLHEVVDAVTEDEPPLALSADEIIAAGRRAERRRRAGFASAGAAGLVVVAVAGAFALTSATSGASTTLATPDQSTTIVAGAGQSTDASWPDAPAFSFTFAAFEAGKFRVHDPIVASTAYQIAPVYQIGKTSRYGSVTPEEEKEMEKEREQARKGRPGRDRTPEADGAHFAYLTLYRPGAFDPSGITDGTPLTVAGHRAVQSTIDPPGRQLAWEYADDAWAVVTAFATGPDPSIEDLSALVTALKPSPVTPARLPFRVGYVPAGYTPIEIGSGALPGLNGIAAADDGDHGGATFANPAPAATGLTQPYGGADGEPVPGSFSIFVTPSTNSNQQAEAGGTRCYPHASTPFCNVWNAAGTVQVQVQNTGELSAAEMTRIAESVKVTDVDDESSWIPATEALAAR